MFIKLLGLELFDWVALFNFPVAGLVLVFSLSARK
jgi:hypothetical protein